MTIKDDQEPFASRWSRLKQEAREQPPEKASAPASDKQVDPKPAPPELLPLDKVTFESDFKQFLHPGVDEDVRRAALKKLFNDPRFNVMDGLDVYIEDYSKADPIPAAMLAGMQTAQQILEWAKGGPLEPGEPRAAGAKPVAAGETPALQEPQPASSPDQGSPATERARVEPDQQDSPPEPSRRKV